MKNPQNLVVLALAVTTVAAGTFGWQQYQRAEQLSQVAEVNRHERAQLRGQLERAETRLMPLVAEVEAMEAKPEPTPRENGAITDAAAASDRPDRPEQRPNSLMENPQFVAAMQAQQRARLDNRYADLFRKLNLNPAQVDEFKALLAERQSSRMDVLAAARDEGLSGRENREELRKLIQQAEGEIDADIRQLLGETAFREYQQYEQTAPQRAVVNQLETRLSYSGAPLTPAQSEALINVLAAASNGGDGAPSPAADGPGVFGGRSQGITDEVLTRAQGVLGPSQIEALREIQAEQEAQRQMAELMRRRSARDNFRQNRAAGR